MSVKGEVKVSGELLGLTDQALDVTKTPVLGSPAAPPGLVSGLQNAEPTVSPQTAVNRRVDARAIHSVNGAGTSPLVQEVFAKAQQPAAEGVGRQQGGTAQERPAEPAADETGSRNGGSGKKGPPTIPGEAGRDGSGDSERGGERRSRRITPEELAELGFNLALGRVFDGEPVQMRFGQWQIDNSMGQNILNLLYGQEDKNAMDYAFLVNRGEGDDIELYNLHRQVIGEGRQETGTASLKALESALAAVSSRSGRNITLKFRKFDQEDTAAWLTRNGYEEIREGEDSYFVKKIQGGEVQAASDAGAFDAQKVQEVSQIMRDRGEPEERIVDFLEFAKHIQRSIQQPPQEKSPALEIDEHAHPKAIAEYLLSVTGAIEITDPEHGAVHGTSRQVIEAILKYGVIPGFISGKRDLARQDGDISIYPTPELYRRSRILRNLLTYQGIDQVVNNPDMAIEDAKGYADVIANQHALLTSLGIPLSERMRFMEDLDQFLNMDSFHDLELLGISREELMSIREEALQEEGFLIAFSPEISNSRKVILDETEDPGSAEITLRPRGSQNGKNRIPYGLISGIEPLGPKSAAFLKRLQAEIAQGL